VGSLFRSPWPLGDPSPDLFHPRRGVFFFGGGFFFFPTPPPHPHQTSPRALPSHFFSGVVYRMAYIYGWQRGLCHPPHRKLLFLRVLGFVLLRVSCFFPQCTAGFPLAVSAELYESFLSLFYIHADLLGPLSGGFSEAFFSRNWGFSTLAPPFWFFFCFFFFFFFCFFQWPRTPFSLSPLSFFAPFWSGAYFCRPTFQLFGSVSPIGNLFPYRFCAFLPFVLLLVLLLEKVTGTCHRTFSSIFPDLLPLGIPPCSSSIFFPFTRFCGGRRLFPY